MSESSDKVEDSSDDAPSNEKSSFHPQQEMSTKTSDKNHRTGTTPAATPTNNQVLHDASIVEEDVDDVTSLNTMKMANTNHAGGTAPATGTMYPSNKQFYQPAPSPPLFAQGSFAFGMQPSFVRQNSSDPLFPSRESPDTPGGFGFGVQSFHHDSHTPHLGEDDHSPVEVDDLMYETEIEREDRELKEFEKFNLSHSLTVEKVETLLDTLCEFGLSPEEAEKRLQKYGKNILEPAKRPNFLLRIWYQVNSSLIFALLVICLISLGVQSYEDFALIGVVLLANVIIGLMQEEKATAASNSLKVLLPTKAIVIRDRGRRLEVPAENVVPGDVVFIEAGEKVPCDLRLFSAVELTIQESMLTGQSFPSSKNVHVLPKHTGIGDRHCIAFSATLCLKGQGIGICVATGDRTEIGKINRLVSGVKSVRTELQKQIDAVGRWIAVMTMPFFIAAFFLSYYTGLYKENWRHALIEATAIAAAILPSSLPAILTITLSAGMNALARKQTIIKALPNVETMGSAMVLCCDKTGTLTKNEMTAVSVRTASASYEVSGAGYGPVGDIKPSEEISREANQHLYLLLLSCALCNDSRIEKQEIRGIEVYRPIGDPTECALLTLVDKSVFFADIETLQAKSIRLGTIPFQSEHKFMAVINPSNTCFYIDDNANGKNFKKINKKVVVLNIKGAPDRLIPLCKYQLTDGMKLTPVDVAYWNRETEALNKRGLRTIVVCQAVIPSSEVLDVLLSGPAYITETDPSRKPLQMTVVGLVGIMDPPRSESLSTIKQAQSAGMKVKMITGDHPTTARAIGAMLSIIPSSPDGEDAEARGDGGVVSGPELDAMSRKELQQVVLRCNIFARASPLNKIQIITALQDCKLLSAMVGDGVNDAPAIAAADIGVAMGLTGTDVSKDAAKMILTSDNLENVIVAVKVGRTVWDNIRKILIFNQPVNFAQGLANFVALCLQWSETPMTAVQVLYINMVTSLLLGLAFSVEPSEEGVMKRAPRRIGKRLIGKMFLWRLFFITIIMIIAVLGSFRWMLDLGGTLSQARGTCVTTLVLMEISYGLSCRFLKQTSFHSRTLFGNYTIWLSNAAMILCQIFVMYTPGVNSFFSISGINGTGWGIALFFSVCVFIIVEIEKAVVDPLFKPYIKPLLNNFRFFAPKIETYHRKLREPLLHEHGGNIKAEESGLAPIPVPPKQDQGKPS